jgi:biopolymer transport protein TolR
MASSDSNDDGAARAITGINVTPLVDVTLVLLIVFLVTAKVVMSRAIPVDVPQTVNHSDVRDVVLAIGIATDGALTLDGAPMRDPETLERAAKARAGAGAAEARAVIAASKASSHGAVIGAVDALRSAGITKIAFAVDRKAAKP